MEVYLVHLIDSDTNIGYSTLFPTGTVGNTPKTVPGMGKIWGKRGADRA